jgi:hypothetical protein
MTRTFNLASKDVDGQSLFPQPFPNTAFRPQGSPFFQCCVVFLASDFYHPKTSFPSCSFLKCVTFLQQLITFNMYLWGFTAIKAGAALSIAVLYIENLVIYN